MSKLLELGSFTNILGDGITDLENKLITSIKKINKEYKNNILDEKIKLLEAISKDENLNLEKLKLKYLDARDLKLLSKKQKNDQIDVEILDKITINGINYYYNTNSNLLYDINSTLIGSLDENKEISTV